MNGLHLAAVCIAGCLQLRGSEASAAWQRLGSLERSNAYTIVLRDGSCQTGNIQTVEPKKLTLQSGVTVQRAEVLYVGEGVSPHNILYSGRSSWNDVREVKPVRLETLESRLKTGKSIRGSFIGASDSDLTVKSFGRTAKISKLDIAEVNYVRFKPVSEGHRYFAQEAAGLQFLDPKAWQYLLRIDALMSVPIYDSAMPEDDAPLSCKNLRSGT